MRQTSRHNRIRYFEFKVRLENMIMGKWEHFRLCVYESAQGYTQTRRRTVLSQYLTSLQTSIRFWHWNINAAHFRQGIHCSQILPYGKGLTTILMKHLWWKNSLRCWLWYVCPSAVRCGRSGILQEPVSRTIQRSKQEVGDLCEWHWVTALPIATNSSFLDR